MGLGGADYGNECLDHSAAAGTRSSCDSCKPLGFGAIGWAHAGTNVYEVPFSYRHVMPLHFDPDGRVKDGIFRLRAEQSISVASRFARVSSFFALITQYVEVRWYQGGWDWKNFQASAFPRNFFSNSGGSFAVNGLLKITLRLLQAVGGSLVPVVATLQIRLECLWPG